MDEFKIELAQKFCERALQIDNDNIRGLELTASLLLDMGEVILAHFIENSLLVSYYFLPKISFVD